MTPDQDEEHRAFVERMNEEISDKEEMQGWGCLAIVAVAWGVFFLALFKVHVPALLAGFVLIGLPYVFATRLLWRAKRPIEAGKGRFVTGREKKELLAISLIAILAAIALELLAPRLLDGW